MKKTLCLILSLMLVFGLVFCFTACDSDKYGKELINDGTFVYGSTYWYALDDSSDGTTIKGTEFIEGEDNNYYLTLSNKSSSGNYYQVYQTVSVKKHGIYKISARIRNDSLAIGGDDTYVGGGIEILDAVDNGVIISTGSSVNSDWVVYTAYIKVKNTDSIKVALTIGGEDARVVGKVSFDDVSVTRVKSSEVPDSADVIKIKVEDKAYALSTKSGTAIVAVFTVFTALLIIGFYFLYKFFAKDEENKPVFKKSWITAGILALVAVAIRLIIAGTLYDKAGTSALAKTLNNLVNVVGIRAAGASGYETVAPFQLYYMWVLGKICGGITTNLNALNVVYYLVPILCEGATTLMIYSFAKKYVNDKQAMLFGALYALLPISFMTSSGYSIELPIFVFFLFITFWSLMEKDYVMMILCTVLNCLWTPLGIYVLPFIVAYEIYIMIKTKDKKTIITILVGSFFAFWAFVCLSSVQCLTMFKEGHIMYIFKNYSLMLFNKQLCVSNAFNLYALFGLNGSSANNTAFGLNIAFSIILIIYSVSLYFKNFNRAEMTLIAGFFLSVMAVFSLNMNENALALGLILLLMYIIVTGEERLFWVFGVLALLAFANSSVIMNYTGFLGDSFNEVYFNKGDAGYIIANIIACITVIYYGWVVYDITTNDKRLFIMPLSKDERLVLGK